MVGYTERLRRAYAQRKRDDGLSQVRLSELTGLSQSVISENMDTDKIGATASVLVRLCVAMDVSLDYVLRGVGDEIPRLARRSAASLNPSSVELREASAPVVPSRPSAPAPPESVGSAIEPPATPEQKARRPVARR
jgi:transcriptional regulator with XRE-family HTH domain